MADLGSAVDTFKGIIPSAESLKSGAFSTMGFIAWALLIGLFIIIAVIVVLLVLRWLKYNKKIVIFEKINGKFEVTKIDRAMEVKFSTAGDTIFYLRKHRKYLVTPTIQTGRRTYWFWIREDGEWINFGTGDFDEDARELHAHFLDKEMRYARTQIQKGLKERYDKPGFWKQYGLLVLSLGFVGMIGIMTWLLFDKWIDLAGTTNAGVETAGIVMDKVNAVMGKLDNICSGGSGILPG